MSSWNLGLLGAAGAPAGAYELIQTVTLASNQASILLNNIPSTYTHLELRCVLSTDWSTNQNMQSVFLRLNGDTGSNYAHHGLDADGSSLNSRAFSSQQRAQIGYATSQVISAAYAGFVFQVLDYASSSKNKTLRSYFGGVRGDSSGGSVGQHSGFWNNTSPVTSISLGQFSGLNIRSNSRVSLYGIKG